MQRGKIGEQAVTSYLSENGMNIIERNYHSRYGEIDIICSNKDVLAFVEVKTRKINSAVSGSEAVNASKKRNIIKTAMFYLQERELGLQPRFDVAEVKCDNKLHITGINYISNAFDMEGCYEFF